MPIADILGQIAPNPLHDLRAALQAVEQARKAGTPGDEAITWLTTAAAAVLATREPQPVVLAYDEKPNELTLEELKRFQRASGQPLLLVNNVALEELRLDKPAMVGKAVFKAGVSWSIVIDAAQRLCAGECPPTTVTQVTVVQGCGACGDACQGRAGGCRVQEESPPAADLGSTTGAA